MLHSIARIRETLEACLQAALAVQVRRLERRIFVQLAKLERRLTAGLWLVVDLQGLRRGLVEGVLRALVVQRVVRLGEAAIALQLRQIRLNLARDIPGDILVLDR